MKQSFDAIVDALADIGLLLPEFQQVRKLFSHNEHIKDVLVFFFRDILDFYLIVLKFFRKKYWGLIFESMWTKQREKINIVRAQLQRHALLLRREVGLEHIQEAQNAQLQALEHYEKTETSFRRQEYRSLKANISPKSYEYKLDSFSARACQGTGQWLLRDTTFAKWLDKADASIKILWLQGIPGAGKTFLTSTVIHKVKEVTQTRTIYAFLSYTFRNSLSALSVIHSLIFQLASDYDDLQEVLCQSGGENLKSSIDVAANLLKTILACAGPTYIVIDGMDEIDEMERRRLLKQLLDLSKTCLEAKIIISSRIEADIADLLKDQVSIQAQAEIQSLLAPLASNAEGLFLYAEVVLSGIDSLDDLEEIREELRVLPESLDAAILDRINRLTPTLKNRVRKILSWVGCALTPLTIQEIEQALVVSREGVGGNANVIAILNAPRICGPIVEVVDDYIQFVHFTVKEYLFSSSIDGSLSFADATLSLATCCVTYLCQMHHDHHLLDEDIRNNILSGAYRLHDYAAATWLELVERYAHLVKQDDLLRDLSDVLETLRCERSTGTYADGAEVPIQSNMGLFKLFPQALENMLRKAAHFRQISLKGNFNKNEDSSWTSLDPLTTSATSVHIYQQFSNLLCQNNEHENCHCEVMRFHCGRRTFKCGVLSCSFRRHGFESRSLQRSHIKHHDRPWKCSIQDCEYAEGGFLSRKMRDDHYRHHVTGDPRELTDAGNPEADEIQPLLFDLIKADKVDVIRNLLPQFNDLPGEIKVALRMFAASFGSAAIIDLILPLDEFYPIGKEFNPFGVTTSLNFIVQTSVQAANLDVFKYLISRDKNPVFKYWLYSYSDVLAGVLMSDSEEFFEEWVRYVDIEHKGSKKTTKIPFGASCTSPKVIRATAGHLGRENWLITVWEKAGILKSFDRLYLGSALVNVATTTCSVKLAKYFVGHGADVNFRPSDQYLTPLHHAARQNSAAAAEMMEYLLLQGADPELTAGRAQMRASNEKGARGIAQWLGMSWDELVAKAKEEREKIIPLMQPDMSWIYGSSA